MIVVYSIHCIVLNVATKPLRKLQENVLHGFTS